MARPVRREDNDVPVTGRAARRQAPQGIRWWIRWLKELVFDPYSVKRAKEAHARRELLAGTYEDGNGAAGSSGREDPGLAGEPEPVVAVHVTPFGLVYLGVWGQPVHVTQAIERVGWEAHQFLLSAYLGPDGELGLPEES